MSPDDEQEVRPAGRMPAGATSSLRWGLTLPFAGVPLAEPEPLVRRTEAAGYDDLWTGETDGADGFAPLAPAATCTERMAPMGAHLIDEPAP